MTLKSAKSILVSFVEIIVFLLAAFGGFLTRIAPPEQAGAPYAIGILSFLLLVALLVVAAIGRGLPGHRFRRRWILAGSLAVVVAIPAVFLYPRALHSYTWSYPPENPTTRLRGADTDFTEAVKRFLKENPDQATPDLLARNFEIDQIWTSKSISDAGTKLLVLYAWLSLSLGVAVFCLLEANLKRG